ncbi:unnamed protein product [Lampetra planeri]
MKPTYEQIPGFKDIRILSIREGSIIVDHTVTYTYSTSQTVIDILNDLQQQLQGLLMNRECVTNNPNERLTADNCTGFLLDMENVTVVADNITINDLNDFCSDSEISEYYTISIINDSQISCIHRCDANSTQPYCANGGKCNATVVTPECVCLPTSIFWHRDSQCNLLANAAAIAGITVPLVLLPIIIVIVVVLVLMRRASTKTFSVESSCSSFSRNSNLSFGSFKTLPEWQDNPNYDGHVEDVREEANFTIPPGVFNPTLENISQKVVVFQRPKILSESLI